MMKVRAFLFLLMFVAGWLANWLWPDAEPPIPPGHVCKCPILNVFNPGYLDQGDTADFTTSCGTELELRGNGRCGCVITEKSK